MARTFEMSGRVSNCVVASCEACRDGCRCDDDGRETFGTRVARASMAVLHKRSSMVVYDVGAMNKNTSR